MSNTNLEVEVKALRLVVERLLAMVPGEVLDNASDSERANIAHHEAGGETIPPTGHVDLEASREALRYYEDASTRRAEFRLDGA
jgi:hypothetical protein